MNEQRETFYKLPISALLGYISHKEKSLKRLYFRDLLCFATLVKWCHHESNEGHKDFQSFALPTELWHRLRGNKGKIFF